MALAVTPNGYFAEASAGYKIAGSNEHLISSENVEPFNYRHFCVEQQLVFNLVSTNGTMQEHCSLGSEITKLYSKFSMIHFDSDD